MVARLYQYRFPQREGLILEYNDGWGEIAPLPNFSQETLSEAKAEILSLLPSLSSAKPTLPSVQFGINCAKTSFSLKPLKVPLCAFLLPEKECQFLKLKVGHLGLNEAISLVNQYKKNYRLRIDCNQKWSLNKALCFSRYFKPTDFDYIEEPVSSFLDLIHFSEQTGFPVAIDEKGKIPFSLEKIPTLKAVVTKPMIIGGVPKRAFPTVLSSTYETSLGHLLIARLATEKMPPIGLGTFSYTTDSILQPPLRSEGGFLLLGATWPPYPFGGIMPHCLCPLKQTAKDSPKTAAFADKNNTATFEELDRQTDLMASQLKRLGMQEGSLIATFLPTSRDLICLFFAAWRLGASIAPLNLRLPPYLVKNYLSRLEPHLFISKFPIEAQKKRRSTAAISQSLFLFTSGSTATPKIAVLSLSHLIANAIPALLKLDLRPRDRWLLSLPLYHVGGIGIMIRSVLARATMVLNATDPNITHLSWVPTQLYRSTPLYKNLRCLLLGGAPIHSAPLHLPCILSYGLTEMGSIVIAGNQSFGHPLKGREVSIASNGEILVRGDCLFQGYWKDSTLEKPFDKEGWFRTGDLGQYCPIKGLSLLGRKDWQFISGGENIQPEEIEAELIQMDSIIEVAVLPSKDPEFGFRPIAFVKTSNPKLTLDEIKKFLSDKLPKYKIPISLFLLDAMPRKGLKMDRKQLFKKIPP